MRGGFRLVESTSCPNCKSPVLLGQAFCPSCGRSLASGPDPLESAPETGVRVRARNRRSSPRPKPAFEPSSEPALEPAPEPALEPAPEPAFEPAPEPAFEPDPALLSDPGVGGTNRIPGSYLAPTEALPPSTWAIQPSSSSILGTRRQGSSPSLSVGAISISTPGTSPAPVATEVAPAHSEPLQELVAFGLSVAGAALGIASFFLPWTGATGIGVGTTSLVNGTVATNQWAFAMPAGIPLLLFTALTLGCIAGSDRAQLELPKFARVIARVTDTILPMILAGLYLGVVLLYATLPWGYGMGIVVLLVAAGLLVAGSVVCIFFPSEPAPKLE